MMNQSNLSPEYQSILKKLLSEIETNGCTYYKINWRYAKKGSEERDFYNYLKENNLVQIVERPSKFSNPYKLSDYSRLESIAKFEEYSQNDEYIQENLNKLKGKVLVCQCYPLPCHAQVLCKMVKENI